MGTASRRAAIGAILAAPLASLPALAVPSELAQACDWAIRHRERIDSGCYSGDAVEAEVLRHEAVIVRAIEEPSRSTADLAAKARMLLDDMSEKDLLDSPYNDDRLIVVVLREAASLCA